MAKIIYSKFDKKAITKLPRAMFDGTTVVVIAAQDAKKAVDFLLKQDVLGIDTETRPSFRKGKQNVVSLLQVATKNICFLFRLNLIGLTPDIKRLLEDTTVPKVGLSLITAWRSSIILVSIQASALRSALVRPSRRPR